MWIISNSVVKFEESSMWKISRTERVTIPNTKYLKSTTDASRSKFRFLTESRLEKEVVTSAESMMESAETRAQEELSEQILSAQRTAEQVLLAFSEARSFVLECGDVGKQVRSLCDTILSLHCFATSARSIYDGPIRCIVAEISKNLARALILANKCKCQPLLRRLVNIIRIADFRKLSILLDASVGDMKWLLSVLGSAGGGAYGGIDRFLPPIVINDSIVCRVWSYITIVKMGKLNDQMEAATRLALLAQCNTRNKNIIFEGGGVLPLLMLLKEKTSPMAQIAAANVLCVLASDQERVRNIVEEKGVPIIVHVLRTTPMRVQIQAANLVARMPEHDSKARDGLAREYTISPLVRLLSLETLMDDPMTKGGKQVESKSNTDFPYKKLCYKDAFGSITETKERENEKPELKLELKISAPKALWMLARGSVQNSRSITEIKGLRCLGRLVEMEQGELQYKCLMTIMEITAAAESDAAFRQAVFKTNSPAVKVTVNQLLRVIDELDSPELQTAAIRSIGSLARLFPASERRVISSLVAQLGNQEHRRLAKEAAIALQKFICPDSRELSS